MNEYSANSADRVKAETIRRQYVNKGANKMDQLQKLDSKVKTPGMVMSFIFGILGALVMGSGMAMIMVSGVVSAPGLVLGIAGMVLVLLAYPLYASITGKRKKQYAQQVFDLTNAIISE